MNIILTYHMHVCYYIKLSISSGYWVYSPHILSPPQKYDNVDKSFHTALLVSLACILRYEIDSL